ncbi:hypothetical protein MLP_19690 [Microlunatus phosphovorus NM-1]|uniref:Uncharacterized protein n=1 Tax=Microlunatus phosphovorus (strain ATCC 700054 / DSM 10555 / JCM 9379 / NBRC 101784 / NCIMB 13414 / VKM Ac-1990 / NM-1) TaxID=1032480 RepID=F5XTB1_MICPN|nr:hypothetical protein MLP_19690 [Microlunatus phosphovorus NM-1]
MFAVQKRKRSHCAPPRTWSSFVGRFCRPLRARWGIGSGPSTSVVRRLRLPPDG